MPSIGIRVAGHEITKSGSDKFAVYIVEVTTDGKTYTLRRRWNDLRQCEEAMKKTHSKQLGKLPKFEVHTWRSLPALASGAPPCRHPKLSAEQRRAQQVYRDALCGE